jgi:hypothetical protein
VHHFVAAAGEAREFVGFDGGEKSGIGVVDGAFFEGARTEVAVQTLAIVERVVKANVLGRGRRAEIVNVDMAEAVHFGSKVAKHGVSGMAGEAGFLGRDAMVLKVGSGQVRGIVDHEAFAIRLHFMTGKTKLGLLGTFNVIVGAHAQADERQQEQNEEGEDLSALGRGQAGSEDEHGN